MRLRTRFWDGSQRITDWAGRWTFRSGGVPHSGIDVLSLAQEAVLHLRSVGLRITLCHTRLMAKAISVRLDDDAQRALRMLEATGLSQSAAIRSALLASAERLRKRSELAAEAAALDADEVDRAEMLSIASMMETMRAPG